MLILLCGFDYSSTTFLERLVASICSLTNLFIPIGVFFEASFSFFLLPVLFLKSLAASLLRGVQPASIYS
jgi:hypothetical protein